MDSSHEGIVVRDAEGHRVKIKTKTYFIMHHLRSNMSLDNAIMLVFKNDYDEFVSYFSEYKELFDAIQFTVDTIRQNAKDMDTFMAKHKQEYVFLSSAEDKKRISGCLTGKESSLFIRAMVAYKGSLAEQLDKYMATTQFITKYIANTRPYWVKLYKTYQDLLEINADVAKALDLKQEKSL